MEQAEPPNQQLEGGGGIKLGSKPPLTHPSSGKNRLFVCKKKGTKILSHSDIPTNGIFAPVTSPQRNFGCTLGCSVSWGRADAELLCSSTLGFISFFPPALPHTSPPAYPSRSNARLADTFLPSSWTVNAAFPCSPLCALYGVCMCVCMHTLEVKLSCWCQLMRVYPGAELAEKRLRLRHQKWFAGPFRSRQMLGVRVPDALRCMASH